MNSCYPFLRTPVSFLICTSFFLFLFTPELTYAQPSAPTKIASAQGGQLYSAGGIDVLVLQGNFRQMGTQYGLLYQDQINAFYEVAIEQQLIEAGKRGRFQLEQEALRIFRSYPDKFQTFFYALADSSGIDLASLVIVNEFLTLDYLNIPGNTSVSWWLDHCSTVMAWDGASEADSLVFGSNFDVEESAREWQPFFTLTILNPTDGSASVCLPGFPGQIATAAGFNSYGMILSEHVIPDPHDDSRLPNEMSQGIRNLDYLLNTESEHELRLQIPARSSMYPHTIHAGFPGQGMVYESSTMQSLERNPGDQTFTVSSNHFLHPQWPSGATPSEDSIQRLENLQRLVADALPLSTTELQTILDFPLQEGGATDERTVFQWVSESTSNQITVQLPGYKEWILIDCSSFFPSSQIFSPLPDDLFVPTDPTPDEELSSDEDGKLPDAVQYVSGGQMSDQRESGIILQFDEDAELIDIGNETFIEFQSTTVSFGDDFPFQFEDSAGNTSENAVAQVAPSQGPDGLARLALGELTYEDVAEILTIDPASGIPLTLFDSVPVQWLGGQFKGDHLLNGVLEFDLPDFPLPDLLEPFEDFPIDLTNPEGIEIPVYGEQELGDGSTNPLILSIPRSNPVWIVIQPSGSIRMQGGVDILFPDGTRTRAEILLNDPDYQISLVPTSLTFELASSLADLLPQTQDGYPQDGDHLALTLAQQQLGALQDSYDTFIDSIPIQSHEGDEVPVPSRLSSVLESLLESWAITSTVTTLETIPIDALSQYLQSLGDSATSISQFEVLSGRLEKLYLFQHSIAHYPDAFPWTDIRRSVNQAIQQTVAAASVQARQPEALRSLEALETTLHHLLEIEALNATYGQQERYLFTTLMPELLERFIRDYVQRLGVVQGVFDPAQNETLSTMNRYGLAETIHVLLQVKTNADLLGIEIAARSAYEEALIQLGVQWARVLTAQLQQADAEGKPFAYLFAANDLAELILLRDGNLFLQVGVLEDIPATGFIFEMQARFGQLLQNDSALRTRNDTLDVRVQRLDTLLSFMNKVPASTTLTLSSIRQMFSVAETDLSGFVLSLDQIHSGTVLNQVLALGLSHQGLSDQYGIETTVPWKDDSFLRVMDRIVEQLAESSEWETCNHAISILLDEASRLHEAEDVEYRRSVLRAANRLIQSGRALVVREWENREEASGDDPLLAAADFILPGDILVHNVQGGILYERDVRRVTGSFQGELEIPAWDGRLFIDTCTLSNAGSFLLSAHGSLEFPFGRAEIPREQPLLIQKRASSPPDIQGTMALQFNNGMAFKGQIQFRDPDYQFMIQADDFYLEEIRQSILASGSLPPTLPSSLVELMEYNSFYTTKNALLTHYIDSDTAPEFSRTRLPFFNPPVVPIEADETDSDDIEQPRRKKVIVKVGLVGDSYVGKTSLMVKYTEGQFIEDYLQTLRLLEQNGIIPDTESLLSVGNQQLDLVEGLLELSLTEDCPDSVLQVPDMLLDWVEARRLVLGGELDPESKSRLDSMAETLSNLLLLCFINTTVDRYEYLPEIALAGRILGELYEQLELNTDELTDSIQSIEETYFAALMEVNGFDPETGQVSNPQLVQSYFSSSLRTIRNQVTGLVAFADENLPVELLTPLVQRERENLVFETALYADSGERFLREALLGWSDLVSFGILFPDVYPPEGRDLQGNDGTVSPEQDFATIWFPLASALFEQAVEHEDESAFLSYTPIDPLLESLILLTFAEPELLEQRSETELRVFDAAVSRWVEHVAEDLDRAVNPDWSIKAIEYASSISFVNEWLIFRENSPVLDDAKTTLATEIVPTLTSRFIASVETTEAWWAIQSFTGQWAQDAIRFSFIGETELKNALTEAIRSAVEANRALYSERAEVFLEDTRNANGFSLPGGLQVMQPYGMVYFNREEELLRGTFRGSAVLPGFDSFLTIEEATIASNGHFTFRGSGDTGSIVDGFRVDVNDVFVEYNGETRIAGDARFYLPNDSSLDVELAYNSEDESFSFTSLTDQIRLAEGIVIEQGAAGSPLFLARRIGERYQASVDGRLNLPDSRSVRVVGNVDNNSFLFDLPEPVLFEDLPLFDQTGDFTLQRLRIEFGDHDPGDGITNVDFSFTGSGFLVVGEGDDETRIDVSLVWRDGQIQFVGSVQNLRLTLPGGVIVELDEGTVGIGESFEGEFTNGRVVYMPELPADSEGNNAELQLAFLSFDTVEGHLHLDCVSVDSEGEPAGFLKLPGGARLELDRLTINNGGVVPESAPDIPPSMNPSSGLSLFGDGQLVLSDQGDISTADAISATISINDSNQVRIHSQIEGDGIELPTLSTIVQSGELEFTYAGDTEELALVISGSVQVIDAQFIISEEVPLSLAMQGSEILAAQGNLSLTADEDVNIAMEFLYEQTAGLKIESVEDLNFGNGIVLYEPGESPVLSMDLESQSGAFFVGAEILVPNEQGTTRVLINGLLDVALNPSGFPQLTEFFARTEIENLNWQLPGEITVEDAEFYAGYVANQFEAGMAGKIALAENSSLALDAAFVIAADDPEDIQIATTLDASQINLLDQLYIFEASASLDVDTKPLAGSLAISGEAGILPRESTPVPLQPSLLETNDFLFSVNSFDSLLTFSQNGFEFALTNGTLNLPSEFRAGLCTDAGFPSVGLTAVNPIVFSYMPSQATPFSLEGELLFQNIGVSIPQAEEFAAELCSATLQFNGAQLPTLRDVEGSIRVPLPEDVLNLTFTNVEWGIDGFPIGELTLENNVQLFSSGDFTMELLGESHDGCTFSGLSVREVNGLPEVELGGGIRLNVPADMVSDESGGPLTLQSCGSVVISLEQLPTINIESFSAGGSFRLGGSEGLIISDAELAARGINFIFTPTEENPFRIELNGEVAIPNGPSLALERAQFVFEGEPFPRFLLGGLRASAGDDFLELVEGFPVVVESAGIRFTDETLPLPQILHPTNVEIILTALASIPPGPEPVVSGRVDDIRATIGADGIPQIQVSGFGLGIENLEIPPLELSGEVYVGGLDTLPEGLFFAGRLGGKINGAGAIALVALNTRGLLGVCLDVGAGPGGIPLGPSGFLLTGVEGGISFVNSNADPCDFTTFISVGDDGRPVSLQAAGDAFNPSALPLRSSVVLPTLMAWDELREMQDRHEMLEQYDEFILEERANTRPGIAPLSAMTPYQDESQIPCPSADCPPPTVNIFCQPHPLAQTYPDRIIIKFSSITEELLNSIDITEERVRLGELGNTADEIASSVAMQTRMFIEGLFPPPDPNFELSDELNNEIQAKLNEFEGVVFQNVFAAVQGILGDSESIYDAIVEAARAGVPCPDATLKLTGTFSYVGVSTALSLEGGFTISTTGAAGLLGNLNLLGVPVGTMEGFVGVTNERGEVDPSLCGAVDLALGPLELGRMRFLNRCEGCLPTLLSVFPQLIGCLGEATINDIRRKVAPRLNQLSLDEAILELSPEESIAFFAELYTFPADELPTDLAQCFIDILQQAPEIWDRIQPEAVACGVVSPSIFGFSLGADIYSVSTRADKTSISSQISFSPSYLITSIFGPIFPTLDSGTIGYSVGFPDPIRGLMGGVSGQLSTPEQFAVYATEEFAKSLENTSLTVGYEFSPLGLKMANAEARFIIPNLTNHPVFRSPEWQFPAARGLPSRVELTMAALDSDLLAQALWRGNEEDLSDVFPEGSNERGLVQGLSFREDYFPHGGMLGASRFTLPTLLVDPFNDNLLVILDESQEPLSRATAALTYLQDTILSTSDIGNLAFYFPAPNPPDLAQAFDPKQMLDALQGIAPEDITNPEFVSTDTIFFQGEMDGQLLGIPIAGAEIIFEQPHFFQITGGIPDDTWLNEFVDEASLTFTMFKEEQPERTLEDSILDLQSRIQNAIDTGAPEQELVALLQDFRQCIENDAPKLGLEAQIQNLRIPTALRPLLTELNASAEMYAFSPRFEPDYEGDGPISIVRRNGGIAFRGDFRFADLIDIENAELAVFPNPPELPGLAGEFQAPVVSLSNEISMQDVSVSFNSSPPLNEPFLDASGSITPIDLGVFSIQPLVSDTEVLRGEIELRRGVAQGELISHVRIDPARIESALFGLSSTTRVDIYGDAPSEPFTFSTEDAWSATVAISGQFDIRDPETGEVILSIGEINNNLMASLNGSGTSFVELGVQLPTGMTVTTFPNATDNRRQQFALGVQNDQPIRLIVRSDGSFEFTACLNESLVLDGLAVDQLDAGACIDLNQQRMILTGLFSGGSVSGFDGASAEGVLRITRTGSITFSASVTIEPFRAGIFVVSGVDGSTLIASVQNDRLVIPNGAELSLDGYSQEPLQLREFVVTSNNEFTARVSSGELFVPEQLRIRDGEMELSRNSSGVTRFAVTSPQLTLFPDTELQNSFSPGSLLIESSGRFQYDSGFQQLNFPGEVTAEGQVVLGYEPDPLLPALTLQPSLLNFGSVRVGEIAERSLQFTNPGGSPLLLSIQSNNPSVFPVSASVFQLLPGESTAVTVRFVPSNGSAPLGRLTIQSTASNSPHTVQVRGRGLLFPDLHVTKTSLDFGEHAIGGGATQRVVVSNLGGRSLSVSSVSVDGNFSTNTQPFTLQPNETRMLFVTFRAEEAGRNSGTLTFESNDENSPHTITLRGAGIEQLWYTLRKRTGNIHSIDMTGSNEGWALSDEGEVLQTATAGQGWRSVDVAGTLSMNSVEFSDSDPTRGWIVGRAGNVFQSADGGQTWDTITNTTLANASRHWNDVDFYNPTTAVFVGDSGRIVRQTTTGSFQNRTSGVSQNLLAVDALGGLIVAVGRDRTVIRSVDQGSSWTRIVMPTELAGVDFHDVKIDSSGLGFIVGSFATILRSTDFGASWELIERQTLPTDQWLHDVVIDGNTVWAVGLSGTVLKSTNRGLTWQREGTSNNEAFYSVASTNGTIWVGGSSGTIQKRFSEPVDGGLLTFSTDFVDFGSSPLGQVNRYSIQFTNRGSDTITLSSIATSDSSFVADRDTLTVEPGQTRRIELRFIPLQETYTPANTSNAQMTFMVDDEPMILELRGVAFDSQWTEITASPVDNQSFRELQFLDETTGFARSRRVFGGNGSLWKTTDGGSTWNEIDLPYTGELHGFQFWNELLGFIVGGDGGHPNESVVLRTFDGGDTWTQFATGFVNSVQDIHMVTSTRGYIALELDRNGQSNTTGRILSTNTAGSSWTEISPPTISFDPNTVRLIGSYLYSTSGGSVWRYNTTTEEWSQELALGGTRIFNDGFIDVNNALAWFVGGFGTLRYTTNATSTSPAYLAPSAFTSQNLNDIVFPDQSNGFVIGRSTSNSSTIFRSDDGGASWNEDLVLDEGVLWSVDALRSDLAWAAGEDHRVWKFETGEASPQGVAVWASDITKNVAVGDELTDVISIRNVGDDALELRNLLILNESGDALFEITGEVPATLDPDETIGIPYTVTALGEEDYSATLQLGTNGREPLLEASVSVSIEQNNAPVIITSDPVGLEVVVDGTAYTTPVIFDSWIPQSEHTLSVANTIEQGSSRLRFLSWNSGDATSQTVVASGQQQTFTASFVYEHQQDEPIVPIRTNHIQPAQIDARPVGFYAIVNNASLRIPALGNFEVSGEMRLSQDRVLAHLESGGIHIPADLDEQPRLVDISSSSWTFEYQRNQFLRLKTQNPSMDMFEYPVAPSSQLLVEIMANGSFRTSLAVQNSIPLIPQIAQLGPGNVELLVDADVRLRLNTTLRAFFNPATNQWRVNEPIQLDTTTGAFEQRITTLPDVIVSNPAGTLRSGDLILARSESGVFSARIEDWQMDVLGQTLANLDGEILSSGVVRMNAQPPDNPFRFGPFALDTDTSSIVEWTVAGGLLVDVAESSLSVPDIAELEDAAITIPAFSLNTSTGLFPTIDADIPEFEFGPISFDETEMDEDNYIRFSPTGFRMRKEEAFLGGEQFYDLNVSLNGGTSFTLMGSTPVSGFFVLAYDSDEPDYQFRGRAALPFAIFAGSAGFLACPCVADDFEDCFCGG